jgi:hypothetical protein
VNGPFFGASRALSLAVERHEKRITARGQAFTESNVVACVAGATKVRGEP